MNDQLLIQQHLHIPTIFPIQKPLSRLDVIVVHGGDNLLRATATAIGIIRESIFEKNDGGVYHISDKVIIFSGAKTNGVTNPSEARSMYSIFQKHIHLLHTAGQIPDGIFIPNRTHGLLRWNIRIGKENILICIENKSVDTEDNAERSMRIIEELLRLGMYARVSAIPLSSGFHAKRIQEAFKRYFPQGFRSLTDSIHLPISAEKILQSAGGGYREYGVLKERSISLRSKWREYMIRIVSRFSWGRRKIRTITRNRVL